MRKRYERQGDSEGDRRDKELAVYGKRETHTDRETDRQRQKDVETDSQKKEQR